MEHTSLGLYLVDQNRFLDVWFLMLVRLITCKSHLSAIVTECMYMYVVCGNFKIVLSQSMLIASLSPKIYSLSLVR